MKKLLFAIIFILFTATVFAQGTNCKQFKTGTYKSTFNGQNVIIKRTSITQSEYLNDSKDPIVFSISWIDDCTYTLKPGKELLVKFPSMPKNAVLTTKITTKTKNSYIATTTANFNDKVITVEIFKISDSYK